MYILNHYTPIENLTLGNPQHTSSSNEYFFHFHNKLEIPIYK